MSGEKCYRCTSSFGIFNKQLGCKNCGFAFCKKCLTKKASIPKLSNEKGAVCDQCFDVLTGKTRPVEMAPPEALSKRMAAASAPPPHQPNASKIATDSQNHLKGLSKEDAAIAERLKKLKEGHKPAAPKMSQSELESRFSKLKEDTQLAAPSEREIAERLAVVRGQDPAKAGQPSSFLKPQIKKTQQEQIDNLLEEISQEVEIDSHSSGAAGFDDTGNDLSKGDMSAKVSRCPAYNIAVNASDSQKKESGDKENWSEVNCLLKEVSEEMEIDAKKAMNDLKKDRDLWERIQRLKAERNTAAGKDQEAKSEAPGHLVSDSDEEEEDDEAATKRIIKQMMAESCLDETAEELGMNSQPQKPSVKPGRSKGSVKEPVESEKDSDELPWCCICNNDAVLRCKGCDGDLYCKRCYKEGHDREDLEDHQTLPYKKRK